jgi:CIC family chloride channel protein
MRISSFFMSLRVVGRRSRRRQGRQGGVGWRVVGETLRAEGGDRRRAVLLLAGATGVGVGLVVVVVEKATLDWLASPLADQPLWLRAAGPFIGLVVAWAALRLLIGKASRDTAEGYIQSFHDPSTTRVNSSEAVGRTLASVSTIGYGGALGLDGPSLYLGGVLGGMVQHRMARLFARDEATLLMVAGAAAGFAAVFKTPAASALFAIEVPYRSDVARRVALPAMIGAVAGYITAALIDGATPLFSLAEGEGFDVADLAGALAVGLLCGLGARGFCLALAYVTGRGAEIPKPVRVLSAGAVLFGLAYLAEATFDDPLSLGSGYDVIGWVADPARSLWLVAFLLLIRTVAVLATTGGGGVGGLFVPLVVAGALLGRLGGELPGLDQSQLWLVVGMAAFAGAGYRTPFAAVAFVAETTGQPGFLIPAVVATAVAQLVMGRDSVSAAQRAGRFSRLDRRGGMPISMVVETDVLTVPPDATVDELTEHHLVGRRQRSVPVVDGEVYCGMVMLDDASRVRRDARAETPVSAVVRAHGPTAQVTWLVRDVLRSMQEADIDLVAVIDSDDRFVGVVTTGAILRLDEILERTER